VARRGMGMMLRYELICPCCKSKFINLIDGDIIFDKNYNERGKITWYRCDNCNNVFGYYVINGKNETKVIEISLNNINS